MPTSPVRRRALDTGLILLCVAVEWLIVARPSEVAGVRLPGWSLPLLVAVLYLPLYVRRRYPRLVLLWAAAVACLPLLVFYIPFAGLMVAVFTVARYVRLGPSVLASLVVAVPVTAWGVAQNVGADNFLVFALIWLVIFAGVWLAGRALQQAEDARRRQQAALLEAGRRRRQQERLALARELHDSVAGSVSAMVVQAAGARALRDKDDPRREAAFEVIAETGTKAVQEMHRVLGLLRSEDEALDVIITETASVEELGDLVEEAERKGLHVGLQVEGHPHDVSPGVSSAAYRVVQESLTNALKHAGAGSSVDIDVHWGRADVELEVRSHTHQGQVPPLPSTGYGLAGLGERIRLVGGTFSFRQEQDTFVTTARLPLAQDEGGTR